MRKHIPLEFGLASDINDQTLILLPYSYSQNAGLDSGIPAFMAVRKSGSAFSSVKSERLPQKS